MPNAQKVHGLIDGEAIASQFDGARSAIAHQYERDGEKLILVSVHHKNHDNVIVGRRTICSTSFDSMVALLGAMGFERTAYEVLK